jgi:hypothetical protein
MPQDEDAAIFINCASLEFVMNPIIVRVQKQCRTAKVVLVRTRGDLSRQTRVQCLCMSLHIAVTVLPILLVY